MTMETMKATRILKGRGMRGRRRANQLNPRTCTLNFDAKIRTPDAPPSPDPSPTEATRQRSPRNPSLTIRNHLDVSCARRALMATITHTTLTTLLCRLPKCTVLRKQPLPIIPLRDRAYNSTVHTRVALVLLSTPRPLYRRTVRTTHHLHLHLLRPTMPLR